MGQQDASENLTKVGRFPGHLIETPAHERMRFRQRMKTSLQRRRQIFLTHSAARAQPDHALGQRKDVLDAPVHLVGQCLLNPQGLAEPFFRLDHAQRDRRKSREVAHGARMTAVEMSSLFSDDPQRTKRRSAFSLQRHQQELGNRERVTLHPAEGASRLSKQDRSTNIQAITGRTVFAGHRHAEQPETRRAGPS
jgi:uncharacterized membrane protein